MSDGTFLLSISGQIEYLDIITSANTSYHCKYEFYYGPDWDLLGGFECGLTQIANVINNNDRVVFNFPVNLQFKSTNPYGWPQIIISIYKEMKLIGYGRAHLPISAGIHNLKVNLSKPKPSSFFGYLWTFLGYQPELLQPKIIASTDGNNLIRMETTGIACLTFNILSQGFFKLGYDTRSSIIVDEH